MMRSILLLVIYFLSTFCCSPLKGQAIEWQNTIGGSAHDGMWSVKQTADGGFILGGWSASDISGDKTEDSQGWTDYWVVKLDSAGEIEWQNTLGGSGDEYLVSIQQTFDSGFICGGYSNSGISGDKTDTTYGGSDFWIVKLDNAGTIEWQQNSGGNMLDRISVIFQTPDSGFICGGTSFSDISGNKTEVNYGESDYWILKLDVTGIIQWQHTYGGIEWEELETIIQTDDGGFICGGSSNSDASGNKTENSNGAYDNWILKLDSAGVIQWQQTIGGDNDDFLMRIRQTASGDFICGGSSQSIMSGDKTETCLGQFDYWIYKLNAAGTILWQNTIGGDNIEYVNDLCLSNDGGFVCAGYSRSGISGDKNQNTRGGNDCWVIKCDSTGTILWQSSFGGLYQDYLTSVIQSADGDYVCGTYSGSILSGDKSEQTNGLMDIWVVKLTERFNTITGQLFGDTNGNSIRDLNEPPVKNHAIFELNSNRSGLSDYNGDFRVIIPDSGSFLATPAGLMYYTITPTMHPAHFSIFQEEDSLNDFAFQPAGTFNDLCVNLTPMVNFRSGMTASYMISYSNVGTTTLAPTIIFYPDSDVTFQNATPAPSSVASDSVVWSIGLLAPFESGNILVTLSVDSGLPIGTLINSGAVIEPVANDANTICNQAYWELLTTGSMDPNDILVSRDTLYNYELASPPYLEYLIRFQNTGNDTAFYVRVGNNITSDLDLSTFEVVATSHDMNLQYAAHSRLMEFTFNNILLPDSNVNEPESHGFIRYRIKPLNSLAVGDSIQNRADIYFDFNQPVATNTAVTEIVMPVGIDHQSSVNGHRLAVYPNPFRDVITIEISGMDGQFVTVGIYDIYGRLVGRIFGGKVTSDGLSLSKGYLHGLFGGIYFVRMESDLGSYHTKIIQY